MLSIVFRYHGDGSHESAYCTGAGKIDFLRTELGGAIDVMRQVKRSLDPANIMNPGKIFAV